MTPVPSAIPPSFPSPLPGISGLAYGVGVLFLVCIAAYLTVKLLYSRGPMGRFGFTKQLIKIIDRYPLSPQRYLLTIEIAGKFYLLGVTEQSISLLTQLDGEALAKDMAWMQQSNEGVTPFNAYLSALSRRWKRNKKEPPNGV